MRPTYGKTSAGARKRGLPRRFVRKSMRLKAAKIDRRVNWRRRGSRLSTVHFDAAAVGKKCSSLATRGEGMV
jgi:hypothetical protein